MATIHRGDARMRSHACRIRAEFGTEFASVADLDSMRDSICSRGRQSGQTFAFELPTIGVNDYNDHYDLSLEGERVSSPNWTVAEAKSKFSEIIQRAITEGPQTITKRGRTAAIVVGAEEWQRKTKRTGNLAEFFAGSPLRGSELKMRRSKSRPRKIRV
jgi:prevent-host-death family protein